MNYFKGVGYFFLSIISGALNDILAKYLCCDLNPSVISFFRFLFSVITLLPIIYFYGFQTLKTRHIKIHLLRGFLLFSGILCWTYGLKYVPITTATIISFSIPLFTLILGFIFLKEQIIWQRWVATILGFFGIFIILKSHLAEFNMMSLILIAAAIIFAMLDIINKLFISKESILGMMFYSSAVTVILSLPLVFSNLEAFQIYNLYNFIFLMIIGISANLLLFFILKAFSFCDATALAPYRYFELLITSLTGYLIFNEIPSSNTLYGACIIIPMTLFIIYSENKQSNKNN